MKDVEKVEAWRCKLCGRFFAREELAKIHQSFIDSIQPKFKIGDRVKNISYRSDGKLYEIVKIIPCHSYKDQSSIYYRCRRYEGEYPKYRRFWECWLEKVES